MYKVKEAADQLGVSRVEIFEILLSQRDIFEPYVTKKNSITYISEEGLAFLKERITLQSPREPKSDWVEREVADPKPKEIYDDVSEPIHQKPEEILEANDGIDEGFHKFEPQEGSEFEQVDDALSEWLKEIQDETLLSETYDGRLRDIRTQITTTRNKILGLDSEIKMKEDALRHYHEIMKDDIRWLEDLERKIQIIVKHKFLENESIPEHLDVSEEEKGNFRKFFKR